MIHYCSWRLGHLFFSINANIYSYYRGGNMKYTPLEDYIQKLYHHLGIEEPYQLEIKYVAEKLDISVYFMRTSSKAVDDDGLITIFIDSRLSRMEQWQDFAHELCHVLRHAGNQLISPIEFIKYQEKQADQFALHFCVPTFMLMQLKLPNTFNEAVALICDIFNVTPTFAKARLEKHIRKLQEAHFDETIIRMQLQRKRLKPQLNPREWSPETLNVLKQLEQIKNRKGVNQCG